MNEMIGYIFTSLKSSEIAVKNLGRAIRRQNRFNGNCVAFAFMTVACIAIQNNELRAQGKKIAALTEEIEELKKTKGE